MDEKFVQGVVGGVLKRHENLTLDKNRIQTLMVEIAANIDLVSSAKGLAKDNPLSIEMWKGYKPTEESKYSKEYLEYWTCDICNKHTHEVNYDYLGNGQNHLECELKQEELQKKSDKIMKKIDKDFQNFDLSKSESNENSKVDMSAKAKRGKK
tara:strand:- start:187 stop:645 length:459 start_codon:yes stop_codon:yes gene_type:complete